MKRIFSFLLSVVMIISVFGLSTNAYSAAKVYCEDKLETVQTKTGFVPGKTAAVTGNCYGFISAVCEKLHGVSYSEGLYGNYRTKQQSGNYYTVKIYETKSTDMTTAIAKQIRDFFIQNAQPGDVVHYGAYTTGNSNSNTHTFMIQHIDSEKMLIYHSNYQTRLDARDDCHIDAIVWSSFVKNPTQTIYNPNDTVYSFNSMFYNKMKSTGLGISINRLTKYENKYYLVDNSSSDETTTEAPSTKVQKTPEKVVNLASTGASSTSISIKWDKAENAQSYHIYLKNLTTNNIYYKDVDGISTSLNNLTEGITYSIKVRGVNSEGDYGSYSDAISVKAQSTTEKVKNLVVESRTTSTISYSWGSVKNATKYYLDIKNETNGNRYSKTVTTNSHTVQGLTQGNVYSVRVKAYTKKGGWGAYSSSIKSPTKPAKVTITSLTSPEKNKLRVKWKRVAGNATSYQVYYSTDKSFKTNVTKKTLSKSTTVSQSTSGFKKGKTYYAKVRAYVSVGGVKYYGAWSSVKTVKCK